MAKVRIERDEMWPYYFLTEKPETDEFEVPEDTIERWKRVYAEFTQMQKEMMAYFGK
jgi:iron-sulfur cluster repair protein YtfE (RIC family)